MRLMVTGAAGFVGSEYVRALLTSGFDEVVPLSEVIAVDSLTLTGDFDALSPVVHDPRLSLLPADIHAAAVADAVAGCDAIVHFAAASHVDASIADAREFAA